MPSALIHLLAGVPVMDLQAGIEWYTRFFGRSPDFAAGDEMLWEVADGGWLFIEAAPERTGTGRITIEVTGLDGLLEGLTARGIDHEPVEAYPNGVRHAKIPDPDGNALAFAESPGGESA
jgi:catechol 2,3-dioxygenase-like lactoylglutathione lyase family enzyme